MEILVSGYWENRKCCRCGDGPSVLALISSGCLKYFCSWVCVLRPEIFESYTIREYFDGITGEITIPLFS